MHRGDVVVVLVLGRLERLGLDQDRALEPDGVLVLDDHVEEPAELVDLARHVGVEQRLVALATTPQHVVRSAQPVRRLHAVGDLRGGEGEQLGVGVRRRAGLESGVREQVGGAPQQLRRRCAPGARRRGRPSRRGCGTTRRTSPPRGRCRGRGSSRTARRASTRTRTRRPSSSGRRPSDRGRIDGRQPRPVERAGAEDVEAVPVERVPVAHGEPQVFGHRAAGDDPIGVVPAEGEGIVRLEAFVADGVDVGEERCAHDGSRSCDLSGEGLGGTPASPPTDLLTTMTNSRLHAIPWSWRSVRPMSGGRTWPSSSTSSGGTARRRARSSWPRPA